ncbi:NAD(P)-dependent oxidoreductase [Candidatus Microgenomates bacterium]|nr:MAG: NAD(P)-dependent oxidoreductase [Candidatus Microgenomates bacterium]
MAKQTSYFITGGFGLIGSAIANKLEGNITILSRTDKQKKRIKKNNITTLLKDIAKIEKKDLESIDVIYHCASTVDNYNILTDPYIDVETNIEGTIRLLEILKTLPKKPKIIYPSTFFIYGNEYERTKVPINEESKTDPLAIYPATKLCSENIIKLYSRLYGIPYLICRLTNVYGENEDFNNKKKGALNFLVMQAIKGETLNIYNGGNFYRDYIYVDDVVSALTFLEKKKKNDTFLIGYGEPVLFRDIINFIYETIGKEQKIVEIEAPSFHKAVGITNFVADISKINNLGWEPKIDFKEGIKRIVDNYKKIASLDFF